MSTLSALRRATEALLRRLSRPGRRPDAEASDHLVRQPAGPAGPTISVIVPVYNVEDYVDECLRSVRGQRHPDLEIIVVDDGSLDASSDIAARHAAEDARIRIIERENGGLGAARNTGVRHATGDYLCFVDSDDLLPPDSLSQMFESAEASGSDIVVGAAVRFDSRRRWRPSWLWLHDRDRIGVSVSDFPAIIRNNYTWSKLYRSSFWTSNALWFREGVSYEDQPLITQLYCRAASIDVLAATTYEWRMREDRSSISQQTHTLPDLADRIAAWDASKPVLGDEAPPAVYDEWMSTLWSTHFHWYLRSPSVAEDAYWTELQEAVARLTEDTTARALANVEPERRVAVELVRRGLRDNFREFVREGGYDRSGYATRLTPRGLLFELPSYGDPDVDIPDEYYVISSDQLELEHRLDRARWKDDVFVVEGWAYYRYLDLTDLATTVSVVLRHDRTGTELEVDGVSNATRTLTPPSKDTWADYTPAAFVAEVPFAELVRRSDPLRGDSWSVRLRARVEHLDRTVDASRVHKGGSVRFLPAQRIGTGLVCLAHQRSSEPLKLRFRDPEVWAHDLRLDRGLLSGEVRAAGNELMTDVLLRRDDTVVTTVPIDPPSNAAKFRLPLHDVVDNAHPPAVWALRARMASDRGVPAAAPPVLPNDDIVDDACVIALSTSQDGSVVLTAAKRRIEIEQVTVQDGLLEVDGRARGFDRGRIRLALESARARSVEVSADLDNGRFTTVLPLEQVVGRFGRTMLASQQLTLVGALDTAEGPSLEGPVGVADVLRRGLPIAHEGLRTALTVQRDRRNSLNVSILPPVGRSARGAGRLAHLERAHLARTAATTESVALDGVLIEMTSGEQTDGNGRAVHHELRRRGVELPIYWAVRDHSLPVPEGGIAVVRDSPEWFERLRTAKYLIDNTYQPPYHRKPPGQVIVQTLDDYPFAVMGRTHWDKLELSRNQVELYDRLIEDWDFLVSPATYATPLLRRELGFNGEVLEIGCPRNDIVQSDEAEPVRTQTRDWLGVGDRTVILYAPTFPERTSDRAHHPRPGGLLDPDVLSAQLGDRYVVLVRGHGFHAGPAERLRSSTGVIDVTEYPDPADLYLAADIAVLGYSPWRFDFGLTGKPMIFLVPDLAAYEQERGWLFDFRDSAPGPLVATKDEVVAAIGDIDRVVADSADAYADFRARYLDLDDGHAAQRLVDAVLVPNGDAPPSDATS